VGGFQSLAADAGKEIVFYCAYGERSAMAVQAGQKARIATSRYLQGGLQAWKSAAEPVEQERALETLGVPLEEKL
jgi:sulfur dioxygenase